MNEKIVAAKNYTLAGIWYSLRFYVIENSLFSRLWKRGYFSFKYHESGWKNNKDRLWQILN